MKSDWITPAQLLPEQLKKLVPEEPMTTHQRSCTEASQCRSCKALILWVTWQRSGKVMPVDVQPGSTNNHTVVITYRKSENKLFAEKYEQRLHEGRRRFVSHFVTCPHSKQNRR